MLKFYCLIFAFFNYINTSHEGIHQHTLVRAAHTYIPAEKLNINEDVLSLNANLEKIRCCIILNKKINVNKYIQISVKNQIIKVGIDTLFLIPDQNIWKTAEELTLNDCLYSNKIGRIIIDAIEIVDQPIILHQLSVPDPHILLITDLEIAIHNFVMMPTLVWTIGEGLTLVGWKSALALAGLFLTKYITGKFKLPGEGDGWKKLKGNQGWIDSDGHVWHKDKKHKDHWDVSDKKGNKIIEVDFNGKKIWPGGPKNKNKK